MNAIPVTIVLVEDDPGHARLIEKNIRRAGVTNEIVLFTDGASALAHLFARHQTGAPAGSSGTLVLLDLNLSDMGGIEVLRRVKSDEQLRSVPVVVLTTTDDPQEIQRCYELGCNAYVTKPVDYEGFAAAIRQLGLFLSVMQVPQTLPQTSTQPGPQPA